MTDTHSEEAEIAVLGCLMLYQTEAAELLSKCHDDYFFWHSRLYGLISSRMTEGKPVDVTSLYIADSELKALDLMQWLENAPTVRAAVGHCDDLAELSDIRKTRATLSSGEMQLNHGAKSKDVVAYCTESFLDIGRSTTKSITLKESAKELIDIMRVRAETGKPTGTLTGYPKIDVETDGLQPSSLIVLTGLPGAGKTTLAMNIAINVARQRPVYVQSIEMNHLEMSKRVLSNLGSLHMNKIQRANLTGNDWDSLVNAAAQAKDLSDRLIIDYESSPTVAYIEQKCREIQLKLGDLALVVIDYFLLLDIAKGLTMVEASTRNSIALNALKKRLNAPILVIAQLNKDVVKSKRRPGQGDLDYGQQLSRDADAIYVLYQDETMVQDGVVNLYTPKTRNSGSIYTHLDNHLQFNRLSPREYDYVEREPEKQSTGFNYKS